MVLEYYKVQRYEKPKTCPHNDGCWCNSRQKRDCYRCGWNPNVAKRRFEEILGKECKV